MKLSSYPTDPEIIHGHDIGDAMDSLWANALRAPRSRPTDQAPSGLAASRFDRLSQEDNREAGGANNAPASNQ